MELDKHTARDFNSLSIDPSVIFSAIADLVGWVEERNPTSNPLCDYCIISAIALLDR
ncbi:hypothetical protein [Rippkaea orientalis]|uniref:hypothetical protein n=1 Tax=Rippkaea orientalis TaxID=2546366 RepID=UPI0002D93691|nr:hypothetical protein [Rippkaea orientalis]